MARHSVNRDPWTVMEATTSPVSELFIANILSHLQWAPGKRKNIFAVACLRPVYEYFHVVFDSPESCSVGKEMYK